MDKSTSIIKDQVLKEFGIDYNTVMEVCYRSKTVVKNRLLTGFEWDTVTMENKLWNKWT